MREVIVKTFGSTMGPDDVIASQHLAVREQQVADGENEFKSGLDSSQFDLKNITQFYVEPGGNFWIARDLDSGAIAGFVGLKKDDAHESTLKRMAVMPEYRGNGIGMLLGKTLVAWATEHDFGVVRLTTGVNERAKELIYDPLGFVVVGHDPIHDDHLMELRL